MLPNWNNGNMTTAPGRPGSGRRARSRGGALGLVLVGVLTVGAAGCGGTEPQVRSPARSGGAPVATVTTTRPPAPAPSSTTTTAVPAPAPAPAPPRAVVAAAGAALDRLVVESEEYRPGYDRGLFAHWVDDDGDGCDTRCEVLAAERRTDLPGLTVGWLSIYDGYSTDNSSELDIDHVVALAEAWGSGAWAWDSARRRAFANDLGDPRALVAVTAATNRSKSDRDPAEWLPALDRCGYAQAWVAVKWRWSLSVDDAEYGVLAALLTGACGDAALSVTRAASSVAP